MLTCALFVCLFFFTNFRYYYHQLVHFIFKNKTWSNDRIDENSLRAWQIIALIVTFEEEKPIRSRFCEMSGNERFEKKNAENALWDKNYHEWQRQWWAIKWKSVSLWVCVRMRMRDWFSLTFSLHVCICVLVCVVIFYL